MDGQGAVAEACDGGEDIVCGFDPTERFRVGVGKGDVVHDRSLQSLGGSVNTAADLLLGQQSEEPFNLVDPRSRGRREVDVPPWSPGKPITDQACLVGSRVVDDDVDVDVIGNILLDEIEEAAELSCAMSRQAFADDPTAGDIERRE